MQPHTGTLEQIDGGDDLHGEQPGRDPSCSSALQWLRFSLTAVKILVMGGTRFVGKPAALQAQGHQLTLFTRGKNPVPDGVTHLSGDRSTEEGLKALQGMRFDVIVDSSGRKLDDSRRVLAITGAPGHRFVYVSSAGVYAGSEQLPLDEDCPTDPQSRHAGKADTETWLRSEGIPFTSFRPTYIYGPETTT